MVDLFFKHDVSLAIDFGKAIEARAGEVLAGVPEDIAARLLRRHDVVSADPGLDVRRIDFSKPRLHSETVASFIAPPQDQAKLIADEDRLQKADDARRALALRAQSRDVEGMDAKAAADREAPKSADRGSENRDSRDKSGR